MSRPALRGFYAILDVKPGTAPDGAALVRRAEGLLGAGPCMLQLRAKSFGAAALRDVAAWLLGACRAARVPFCVNDRLDVALAVGADAVHLGQDDLPLSEARQVAAGAGRADLAIGVSTHDPAQARAAAESGADYVGFGPIFQTHSKERPDPVVGLEALRRVAEAVRIPVVAIGGIDLDSVPLVAGAGARAAAVISAVEQAPDPTEAGRRIAAAFAAA